MLRLVEQSVTFTMVLMLLAGSSTGAEEPIQPEPPAPVTSPAEADQTEAAPAEATPAEVAPAVDELELLVSWMSGSFSSRAQSAQDDELFDIRLRMAPIWTDRDDGRWLYVEQAVAEHQDKPYRQRVYQVTKVADNLFESKVFLLPDAASAVAAWRQEEPLSDVSPEQLVLRTGCSILLRRRGDSFHGSTLGSLCESSLRGASYATSEVTITADRMVSWDRGFDAEGNQVWGAKKGGYRFDKLGGLDADEPVTPPAPAATAEPSDAAAEAAANQVENEPTPVPEEESSAGQS